MWSEQHIQASPVAGLPLGPMATHGVGGWWLGAVSWDRISAEGSALTPMASGVGSQHLTQEREAGRQLVLFPQLSDVPVRECLSDSVWTGCPVAGFAQGIGVLFRVRFFFFFKLVGGQSLYNIVVVLVIH